MSNEVKTKEKVNMDPKYIIKLTVTLLLTCMVVAGLLGWVNSITKDKIAAITWEKTVAAMQKVIEADDFSDTMELTDDMTAAATAQGGTLAAVYQAQSGGQPVGYAINVEASGSQGTISMMVGIDMDGAVTGVSIVTNSETSGIGSKVMSNEPLTNGTRVLDQFIGKSAADGVLSVGSNVDAITGATPLAMNAAGDAPYSYMDMMFGLHAGALGETCIITLLAGYVFLLVMRVVDAWATVPFIATVAVITGFAGQDAIYQVLSGGLALGAFYMATDYTTTPMTPKGKIIFGIGCGLLLHESATTGGTEMAARLLKLKFQGLSIGSLCLGLDVAVTIGYALCFRDMTRAMYGVVALYILSLLIDRVVYGPNASKVAYIISEQYEAITQKLLQLDRGVTLLDGKGAWSGQEKRIILCAFGRRHFIPIKKLVQSIDPDAFVIVCDAHEVLGEGFGEYQKEL